MARKKAETNETAVVAEPTQVEKKPTRARKPKAESPAAEKPARAPKVAKAPAAPAPATSLLFMAPDLPTPVIDPKRNKPVDDKPTDDSHRRLREELNEAVLVKDAPTVIRFPKGVAETTIKATKRSKEGVDYLYESPAKDVLIVAIGSMATTALETAELLKAQGIGCTVIDPRWVVPVPRTVLDEAAKHRLVVTIEDGVKVGGIGTRIRQDMRTAQIDTALNEIGLPDEFLEHASRDEILERVGLTAKQIAHDVVAQVLGAKVPHAKKLDETTTTSSLEQH